LRGCFDLSKLVFLLFLDFYRVVLVILGSRILLKKTLLMHASARDGLHTIHVARESSCSNQNPASAVVLGAARMLAEEIRLGCGESFFSSLFSLENHA
jgi:hypothetical protein